MQETTRDMIRKAIRLAREARELQAQADRMGEDWEGWEPAVRKAARLLDEAAALYGEMK